MFEVSKELKADAMITGHYVKSITSKNETSMYQAIDETRDQSYFLFNTTKDQLNYLRFPIGGMLKDETRQIAKELELKYAADIDEKAIRRASLEQKGLSDTNKQMLDAASKELLQPEEPQVSSTTIAIDVGSPDRSK